MVTEKQTPLTLVLADAETLIVENPQKAEAKILRIFSRAKELHDDRAQLIATMQLARIAWHLNQFEKGIKLCERAESLLLPEFESQCLAELYHVFALQFWGLERFRSAHHYWNLAMEKSLVHNQLNFQIESLIGVGNVWRVNKELDLSYSALSLAMTLAEQYDLNILAGKSAILLSWVLNSLKQHGLMLEVLNKAEISLQNHPDLTWYAEIKDSQSIALANLGRISEAEAMAEEVDKINIENRGRFVEAHIPMSKAMVASKLQKFDLARLFLDEAEGIALRFNQLELLSEIYWLRYELESDQKISEAMLFYYKKYRKFYVKLLRSRSISLGKDKCHLTVGILNYKTELLISRLEAGAFNASEGGFPAFREASIWLFACQRAAVENNQAVYIIELNSEKELIAILPIVHALCEPHELITRFKKNRLALLLQMNASEKTKMLASLESILASYPWWRIGKSEKQAVVKCYSVNEFLNHQERYFDKIEGGE